MSFDDVNTPLQVRDVMSPRVVTVRGDTMASEIAVLMDVNSIGSIVVTDDASGPTGIITERDMVARLVAKNLKPDAVSAKTIMSSPLITISPEAELVEAARLMHKSGIRRLVVMDNGKMVGIVTSNDIVGITPALVDIITEKVTISRRPPSAETSALSGYCDRCGQWSEYLLEKGGDFLCEECSVEEEMPDRF